MKAPLARVAGLVLLAAGVALVRAPSGTASWPDIRWLERYVPNPVETLVGLGVAIAAAVLIVAATRRPKPAAAEPMAPEIDEATLGEPPRLLWALAAACALTLVLRLALGIVELVDVVFFAATLVLGAIVVRSLDPRRRRATGIRKADLAAAIVIAAATAALHSIGSDHWLFVSIGDELPFFEMAREIAGGAAWNAFDVVGGVYGTHSLVDSAYHAAVMTLVGRVDVVGWRLAVALLMGASAAGLYLTGVVARGRLLGWAAAAVLASSHYLMAFSHIGYNNSHAVFANVLAALALTVAWRTGRWHHHWLAGVALGLCLYTFLAGILFWAVAAVAVLWEILRRRSPRHRLAVAFTLLAFALTVAPALWATTFDRLEQVGTKNTVALAAEHHSGTEPLHLRLETLLRSVLAFWSDDLITGHHLGGALLDPLTGALLVLGLVAACVQLSGWAERLAVVWLVVGMVLIAASHYEPTPSTSRMLTLMPAVALLAGVAVQRVVEPLGIRAAIASALLLWLVLPWLNLHQLFVASPARAMATGRVVMVMKALQEHAPRPIVDVGTEPDGNIEATLGAYPWLSDRYRFLRHDDMPAEALQQAADAGAVFFLDQGSQHLVEDLRSRLPLGFQAIDDTDRTGQYHTTLFVVR